MRVPTYDPLIRDLLELKELAHALVGQTQITTDNHLVLVQAADVAALARCLTRLAAHGDQEAAWRRSTGGRTASVTAR